MDKQGHQFFFQIKDTVFLLKGEKKRTLFEKNNTEKKTRLVKKQSFC